MYLLEHDAKELLAEHGIAVPAGRLVQRDQTLDRRALPPGPWMVKAQLPAGGRGKAGLVRACDTPQALGTHCNELLGATVAGRTIEAVRIETQVSAAREIYLGLLLDPAGGDVRAIVSANGGVDIEQVPRDEIHSASAPAEPEALAACMEALCARLPAPLAAPAREAAGRLARAFVALEALLLEVNPLFVLEDGRWIAGDAKLVTDDNALPRQDALRALVERRREAYPDVARKLAHGFDYVVVDPEGELGLLTTGAGLSMMLIDELRAAGLRPYNFLDIRTGGLRGETTRLVQVLRWMAQGPRVRAVLVNIFAGITDLAEFSRLLVAALEAAGGPRLPVVARLVGNGLPAARDVLAAAGIPLHTDLDEALAAVRRHLPPDR